MEESHLQTEAGSVAKHLSNREMALIDIFIILSLIGSTMPAKGFRLIYLLRHIFTEQNISP